MAKDRVQHTPGPWRICGDDRGGCECRQVWATEADVMIAVALMAADENYTGGQGIADRAEAVANARLIAVAPELLEALIDFADSHLLRDPIPKTTSTPEGRAYLKACAAIAKAVSR